MSDLLLGLLIHCVLCSLSGASPIIATPPRVEQSSNVGGAAARGTCTCSASCEPGFSWGRLQPNVEVVLLCPEDRNIHRETKPLVYRICSKIEHRGQDGRRSGGPGGGRVVSLNYSSLGYPGGGQHNNNNIVGGHWSTSTVEPRPPGSCT